MKRCGKGCYVNHHPSVRLKIASSVESVVRNFVVVPMSSENSDNEEEISKRSEI